MAKTVIKNSSKKKKHNSRMLLNNTGFLMSHKKISQSVAQWFTVAKFTKILIPSVLSVL